MTPVNPLADLGSAPDHLTAGVKKIWLEVAQLAQPGVLQKSDRWTVEIACTLLWRFRAVDVADPQLEEMLREMLTEKMLFPPIQTEMLLVKRRTKETDAWAAVRSVNVSLARRNSKAE